MNRLRNKTAIVTGGGTGIGRAIATTFAREGAGVAVCGRREAPLSQTVKDIREDGGEAFYLLCDVARPTDVERMVARTIEKYGKIDILCNNAGVRASIATAIDISEQEWQNTLDIDLKGSHLCCKAVIPHMKNTGGGSIIMITSISAHVGQPKQGAYNIAKAGQEMLMRCLALDFAADQIRVNSICPAWIETDMNRDQLARMRADPGRVYPPGVSYSEVLKLHPLGRIGQPEDVAWAAVYLASVESAWVTGACLMVDGGYTCK